MCWGALRKSTLDGFDPANDNEACDSVAGYSQCLVSFRQHVPVPFRKDLLRTTIDKDSGYGIPCNFFVLTITSSLGGNTFYIR